MDSQVCAAAHVSEVPATTPWMNAARALRQARRLAGLSQTELARRAAVPVQHINRIERAVIDPRVGTLVSLLAAAGARLEVSPCFAGGVDRGPIRDLLAVPVWSRLSAQHVRALDHLARRRVVYVVVGDAAARLHGAPVQVETLEIVPEPDDINLRRLARAQEHKAAKALMENVVHQVDGFSTVREDAAELPWLPAPTRRVLNRWTNAPTGFVASIGALARTASQERRKLLSAVEEELDRLRPGLRVYRARER